MCLSKKEEADPPFANFQVKELCKESKRGKKNDQKSEILCKFLNKKNRMAVRSAF